MDVLVLGAGVSGHTAAAFLRKKPGGKQHEARGYKDEFYPPIPTRFTKHIRTNILVQIYKFFRLNLKIMRIVVKGHS